MIELEKKLMAYALEHMGNKEDNLELLRYHCGINNLSKKTSYKDMAAEFRRSPGGLVCENFRNFFREKWDIKNGAATLGRHISALRSGKLEGHDWCGARPSHLHLSFQGKVRECIDGTISLDEYLEIGLAITKHEYYIVAVHDVCETTIIKDFQDVVPAIGHRSLSDFIFQSHPMDLKVTNYPENWQHLAGHLSENQKKQLATELYEGADIARMRKTAASTIDNWGLNRMYITVKKPEDWLLNPEGMLERLKNQLRDISSFEICVNDFSINMFLVEI